MACPIYRVEELHTRRERIHRKISLYVIKHYIEEKGCGKVGLKEKLILLEGYVMNVDLIWTLKNNQNLDK